MAVIIGILAIINALGYLAVVYAFRASFRELQSATWWFAMGFAILAGAIILRGLYWDVTMPLLRGYTPEFASGWHEATNGRMFNILFAVMKTAAFFCALKCRQMMIEESERAAWPWWKAWCHPSGIRLLPWRW